VDLPRIFTIRERDHRIHNAFTAEKLAVLGAAIRLRPGLTLLDLACGSGELLCTWSRDHGITGTGVDISTAFVGAARARAAELGVTGRVDFIHGDAAGFVAPTPVDIAACVGATWIGGGVPGTLDLLERSLRPGDLLLVGEPFWRLDPPDQAAVEGSGATAKSDFHDLPGLIETFGPLGWGVFVLKRR
jgi:SAM-dependent methyltransferase